METAKSRVTSLGRAGLRALGCRVFFCLTACAAGVHASDRADGPSLPPASTPSPTPFQPETQTAAASPSAAATPSPSATATRTPYRTPPGGETLRFLADALGFGIGSPYQALEARDPSFAAVMSAEFNVLMLTTFMKRTQPDPDRFDWTLADEALGLARRAEMTVVGGPLVYGNAEAPGWLGFSGADCGGRPAGELERIMKTYIQTVVSRFRGEVAVWEVVNEPLTNGNNCWRAVLGDGYIGRAFEYAHEADPGAALMLNEAFGWDGVDRDPADRFLDLVRRWKDSGVPLDTVGIQLHLNAETLRLTCPEEFRYFLGEARRLGVTVMITEMDVYQGRPGFTDDPFGNQRAIFEDVAGVCLSDPVCTHLLFWGLSDKYTWLARIRGDPFPDAQPLLFDAQFRRKPAYFGILNVLRRTLVDGNR
jgi:endo-1,4-beta-xylanase